MYYVIYCLHRNLVHLRTVVHVSVLSLSSSSNKGKGSIRSSGEPQSQADQVDPDDILHLLGIGALIDLVRVVRILGEEQSSEFAEDGQPEDGHEPVPGKDIVCLDAGDHEDEGGDAR